MRRDHLERLQPVCPTCRVAGRQPRPLCLGPTIRADGNEILESVLLCPEPLCQREHPIIDGIPIVVADLQSWATHQLSAVLRRDDLSAFTESMLGDAAGPDSPLDRERATLSSYGRVHWGTDNNADQATFTAFMDSALELLDGRPRGMWIDLGCAVGRGTVEIARRTGELAVGVDLSFAMLRVAQRAHRQGRAIFPLRRVGLVYDRCEVDVSNLAAADLGFWCCDVNLLPFAESTFDGALSLNVLDCVPSPLGHLMELARVLRPGAAALLSSPYDWNPSATHVSQWLGGHSQRGPGAGSSGAELRRVLAAAETDLNIVRERDDVAWRVYLNERAWMDYSVHVIRVDRSAR